MRTSPLIPAPQVRLGPQGWRAPSGGGAAIGILAPPGTYTVKLSVGGGEQTERLTVRKDPNTAGTEADIEAQTQMLFDLRRDLNTAIDVLNRIEIVRSQLEALGRVVDDGPVRKAADDLNRTFIDLEMTLIDLRITGGQDGVRYAAKLISRFGYLANGVSNADFRPTNQHPARRGALMFDAGARGRAESYDPAARGNEVPLTLQPSGRRRQQETRMQYRSGHRVYRSVPLGPSAIGARRSGV